MNDLQQSLADLANRCREVSLRVNLPEAHLCIKSLEEAIESAAASFSGSWLGYHSRVYYEGLQRPPAGAHFSPEWGLRRMVANHGTIGDWSEFDFDDVYEHLKKQAVGLGFDALTNLVDSAADEILELHEELISILSTAVEVAEDSYLRSQLEKVTNMKPLSFKVFLGRLAPTGTLMSRDTVAASNGLQSPPHITLLAQVQTVQQRLDLPKAFERTAKRVAAHLLRSQATKLGRNPPGTKVFLGHGRSGAWKDLKDFIQDRLELDWDEFNRVPVAGISNVARLSQMLDDAAIAFLVMTAEDEQKDGKLHARMNVVHEAGLFQGRLSFSRAIVVLEDGCEEFSNIQGLGQIRFPKGQIKAAFEEIRQVLEREGLLGET